jgi:hypothetical protein
MIAEKVSFSELNELQPQVADSQTLLDDVTSTSKVANWRLILWICAFGIWTHEKLWDVFQTTFLATAEGLIPGTLQWYVNETKAFQYGDDLVWDGDKYEYEDTVSAEAEAKRIITQAAAVESNRQLIIKVAKGEIGSLTVLTTDEENAYSGYLEQIKFAGTGTTIINSVADDMKVQLIVTYDPLVLSDDGELLSTPGTYPVNDAITNYLQEIPFNNEFTVAAMIDAIQAVSGVLNVTCKLCFARSGAAAYEDILATEEENYNSYAGYIVIDSLYPLGTSTADTYDPSATYNIGDEAIYSGIYYECNTNGTTGAWNAANWDEISNVQYNAG